MTRPRARAFRRLAALAGAAAMAAGCPRPFHQRFAVAHDVDFAAVRSFAALAEAAYGDDAAAEAACRAAGYELVAAHDFSGGGNRYFLAADHVAERYLIAVRGTSNFRNVKLDVEFDKFVDPLLDVHVHRGFRKAAAQIYDDIVPRMNKGYAVSLTGHSLGGAQAAVLGMYFSAAGWHVSQVVTFGQPKVTDKRGARKYATLPLLRVVNVNDPVPMVPPREFWFFFNPYRHLGNEVLLLDGPYYCFLEDGNESDPQGTAFWMSADSLEGVKDNLPQHAMDTYLSRLAPKLEKAEEVPYEDRLKHFTLPD